MQKKQGVVLPVNGRAIALSPVTGSVFMYDERSARYLRKESERATIMRLGERACIVNVITRDGAIDAAQRATESGFRPVGGSTIGSNR